MMIDDEIADSLMRCVAPDVYILVISDCCHSGTMCDFTNKHGIPDQLLRFQVAGIPRRQETQETEASALTQFS